MRYTKLRDSGNVNGRQRVTVLAIGVISTLCLISFLFSQNIVTTLPPSPSFLLIGRSIQSLSGNELVDSINTTQEIEYVLRSQRKNISKELKKYNFPKGKYGLPAKKLQDFLLENGGQPLRSIIVTTWRSGSTFLGDILDAVPGNYYHYEPLLHHGIVQIRGPPSSLSALHHIKNLLFCNYTSAEQYLAYGFEHKELLFHNKRLWEKCVAFPYLCYNPTFLNKYCSLFPFQSMKVVRLRLGLIEELLKDAKLGIRVLYVVRDPRGTMQSRKHRSWCPDSPDCHDPELLCADLTADFSSALRFTKKFPKTFRAVRYEDISINPHRGATDMLAFFGREYGPSVKKFLDTHTVHDYGGVSSTFRNSKSAPFHWRSDLTHEEVQAIQGKCKTVMAAWGYARAHNSSHQKSFNPIEGHFALEH